MCFRVLGYRILGLGSREVVGLEGCLRGCFGIADAARIACWLLVGNQGRRTQEFPYYDGALNPICRGPFLRPPLPPEI